MKLIKLPIALGTEIVKILKKSGIEPRTETDGPFKGNLSLEFTQEELDSVEQLEIINPTSKCLEGIEHLRKLKELKISSVGETAYQKVTASISDKDISMIAKITSLESLTIDNQSKISWVYLDKLVNLKKLSITRNTNLEQISGLDQLSKLEEFIEYGNKNLYQIDGINEMIKQNKLEVLELDLMHYDEVQPSKNILINMSNCSFSELISGNTTVNYRFLQLSLFHKKCQEIANQAKLFSENRGDQIIFIEKYIADNKEKGINIPSIIAIPQVERMNNQIIFESNNNESEKFSEIFEQGCQTCLRLSTLTKEYPAPLVVPLIPGGKGIPYLQQLSKECFQLSTTDLNYRIDEQIVKIIEQAKEILNINYRINVSDKIFLNGYSSSGVFAQRFSLLHPELIETACIGGASGSIPIPTEKLGYPLGIKDYETLFGKIFDF